MPCTRWFVKTVAQSWFKLTSAKQSRVKAGTLLLPQSGEFWTHLMSQMNWKMQTDGRRQSEASPSSFPSDHWIQANNFVYFILNLQANLVFLRLREHRTGAWSKRRAGCYWPVSSFPLLCNTMSLALTHLALFIFFPFADTQFGTEFRLFFTCYLNQAQVTSFSFICKALVCFFSSSGLVYTNRIYFADLLL